MSCGLLNTLWGRAEAVSLSARKGILCLCIEAGPTFIRLCSPPICGQAMLQACVQVRKVCQQLQTAKITCE